MGLYDSIIPGAAQNLVNAIPMAEIPAVQSFTRASIPTDPSKGQWSFQPGQQSPFLANAPSPFSNYLWGGNLNSFTGMNGNTTGLMPSLKDLPFSPMPAHSGAISQIGQWVQQNFPTNPAAPKSPAQDVPGSTPLPQPGPTPTPSPTGTPTPAPANSDKGLSAVNFARQQLGDPYLWGGTSPSGFDCSGLVQYAYAQAGLSVPRTSQQQYAATASSRITNPNDLEPGDLVFFATDGTGQASHVGIYVGNGQMINAPDVGQPVQYANITQPGSYWQVHFMGGGRPE